jgi:hypothetical protein
MSDGADSAGQQRLRGVTTISLYFTILNPAAPTSHRQRPARWRNVFGIVHPYP